MRGAARHGVVALLACGGCERILALDEVKATDAAAHATLVAYYPFDDASFADATGAGPAATCTAPACPTIVPGRLGNAARFDGIDDLLTIASTPRLDTPAAFSVAFWIKLTGVALLQCPVNKSEGPIAAGGNSWQVCSDAGGYTHFYSGTDTADSSVLLDAGAWHHVAIRFDGVTKVISIDGADTGVALGHTTPFDDGAVTVGADVDDVPTGYTNGLIDELRIYDGALSPAEIAALATP